MTNRTPKALRVALGGVMGGAIGFLIGAIWMQVTSEETFGDLAAAAVTRVFLIPVGFIVGAVVAWFQLKGKP